MKKLTFVLTSLISAISFTSLYAQDGALDTNFGDDGVVNTIIEGEDNFVTGIFFEENIMTILTSYRPVGSEWVGKRKIRYNLDGSLNDNLNSNIIYSDENLRINSIFPDGGVIGYYGGGSGPVSDHYSVIKKFNPDGTPDITFGSNGMATELGILIMKTEVQPDGKILCVGWGDANSDGEDNFVISRYNADGVKDTDFANNGTMIIEFPGYNSYQIDCSLDSNNRIIAIGICGGMDDSFNAIVRYNIDGTVDTTFGTGGVAISPFNPTNNFYERFKGMEILPDDSILAWSMIGNEVAVYKFNPNGTPDISFGNNGISICHYADIGFSEPYDMAVQADGKIIVVGHSSYTGQTVTDSTIYRLNPNGTFDNTFGENGRVIFSLSEEFIDSFDVLGIQPDGGFIVAPYYGSLNHIVLMRFISSLNMGIIDFTTNNTTFVYPNPLDETSVLEYTLANDEQISIELIDMQGKVIKTYASNSAQAAGNYKLPLSIPSDLASGTYMLTLSSSKGKATIKVIK